MNVYTPDNSKEKFPGWEFIGKPIIKFNKKWIKARHYYIGWRWYFCFDTGNFYDSIRETLDF